MAFADYLSEFGLYPTILTHRWERDEVYGGWKVHEIEEGVVNEEYDSCHVIRLPRPAPFDPTSLPLLRRKAFTFLSFLKGQPNPSLKDSYSRFKSFLEEHLNEHRYDLLVGIFSPHFALKLTHDMGEKFGIPYAMDLRDLWTNRIINRYYEPGWREQLQDRFTARYWRKWLSQALFFSTTSRPWADKIEHVTGKKGIVVKNGYEEELFQEEIAPSSEEFRIVHTGSLYNHQKLELFLEGAKRFWENFRPDSFRVDFIGGDRKAYSNSPTSFTKDPESRISKILPNEIFSITPRIPKQEAIRMMKEAQILLFPSFPDSPGTYSGKIFDYLGARRPILSFPHDNSVVDELLFDTNAGTILDTPEEIEGFLGDRYREWKEKGCCAYEGTPERVEKYSRREQVRVFAEEVKRHLG